MEEAVCDMEVLAGDIDVLAGANGERLVKGDARVPPASRPLSSRAINSASLIPSDDSGYTWVQHACHHQMERAPALTQSMLRSLMWPSA